MTIVSAAITSNLRHRNPPSDGDPYFDSVVLLLPFDGTDGDTTTTDYSNSAHSMTFFNNAQIDDAKAKFGPTSYVGDGTSDLVYAPDTADWDFGTGDFTIELWVNLASVTGTEIYCMVSHYTSSVSGFTLQWRNDSYVGSVWSLVNGWGDTKINQYATGTPEINRWYHIAWAREGTTSRLFLDGALVDSDTNSTNMTGSTQTLNIGGLRTSSSTFSVWGNIDDVRITKGIARYTGAFTPPTSPHPTTGSSTPQPVFSNVVWLMGYEGGTGTGTFTEESNNGWTVTPFTSAQRTSAQSKFGSNSGETIGGTSSRFTIDDNAVLEPGSSDFSIETFVRFDSVSVDATFFACWHASSEKTHIWWWDQSATAMTYQYSTNGTAIAGTFTSTWSPSIDTWYHIAVCRNGADLRMFVDGTQIGTTEDMTGVTLHNSTRQKHVGFSNTTQNGLDGFTDEFRYVIGEGIYTSNFTAPTAAHPRS